MAGFVGDFQCKVDAKGRISFPSALKKQMDASSDGRFVLKKDLFEACLVLYPIEEWERKSEQLRRKLNPYNKKHNQFLRNFFKGSAEVMLDGNGRLLLSRRLMDQVDIAHEVVLAGQYDKIEVWAASQYEAIDEAPDDVAAMAEELLGNEKFNDEVL
jgi:MraZ protein